jgi:NADPH:quinone reductase-like Zn-dependent oxidoreductase
VEPQPRKRRGVRVKTWDAKAGARRFVALKRASEAARLKVPIGASYRLADAAKAHRRVEGHVLGKVVLIVRA